MIFASPIAPLADCGKGVFIVKRAVPAGVLKKTILYDIISQKDNLKKGRSQSMCAFFRNTLLKGKAKRLLAQIEKTETALTVFSLIPSPNKKVKKYVAALLYNERYVDIISRYNVCVQKIEKHNEEIRALTFAINSILEQYPILTIVDSIPSFSKDKIESLISTVKCVYTYVVPNSCERKSEYDLYKTRVEEILADYDVIVAQKDLIASIESKIENLPDIYIDDEAVPVVLSDVFDLLEQFNAFPRKYFHAPAVDAKTVSIHNESFIENHLHDSVFDNVNGKSLDEEQRRAILCDSKSNLTVAGAGSGKTLTICGKVKFLLETGAASPEDILLLSYSKSSAKDLEAKVSGICDGLTVDTFHALGLKVLTEASGKKKAIEEQLKAYISRFFEEELLANPSVSSEVLQYLAFYFYAAPTFIKKYKNDGDLFKELKALDFRTLKDRLGALSADKDRHETLKKEFVKSNEELVIANYLYTNGIKYEYEKPYEIETSTPEKRQYTPDFYLPDYGIYLEHYGIDRNGTTPQYDEKASAEYIQSINWKRQTHQKNNTICLETYSYEFKEGTLFENLKSRLLERGVEYHPLSQTDVFNALHNVYAGRDFTSFLTLIMTFISLYKAQITDDSGFEDLKAHLNDSTYDSTRARLFLDICKDVYNYYMDHLREADKIDFDDMILQSIALLDSTPNFKYKYIIVDEFQDISQSRTRFLQKLIEHGNSKLFAVGDDWQAIYRFAGCDINVFLDFKNIFAGAKINYITSTHRNSAELQEIVEPFITANPSQYKKHIRSAKSQDKPVRIVYHKGNKAMAFTKALEDISTINANANVLVLGRNRRDADALVCKEIQIYDYTAIKHFGFPKLTITYNTVHGSKGLEQDFVILISGEDAQNGFPNKTEDDCVLTLLLGKKNSFLYAEERRLFYVALTRTKSIVYILSDKSKSSDFVKEIKNKCFIMEDESEEEENVEYLCPWCKSGCLVVRKSEVNGKTFYGCSNFPYCTYTNDDLTAVYRNKRCPACGDFLVLRKGMHGLFYGCHNYPRCRYTQQYTPPISKNKIGF